MDRGFLGSLIPLGLVGTGGGKWGVKVVVGTVEINSGVLWLPLRHLTTRNQSNYRVIR